MTELKLLLKNIANLFKVKTIITLMIVAVTCIGFSNGSVPVEVFVGMAMAVITYYFTKAE